MTANNTQSPPRPKSPRPHIVECRHVHKRFKRFYGERSDSSTVEVLKNFSFRIRSEDAGSFIVLLGPSECGKSTLLNLISGSMLADEGEVRVMGKPVTAPTPETGIVRQTPLCLPWLTVLRNVELGFDIGGKPAGRNERRELAMEYLKKVGLEERRDYFPARLTPGARQRVAIARTLAMRLPIVLMDDPFNAFDPQTRTEMQQMVLKLWGEEKNTIIFVTNDIFEALLMGDRVVVFPSRPLHEEFFEITNLDGKLGHDRPPELMRDELFIRLYERVREELSKKRYPLDSYTHSQSLRF